MKLSFKTAVTAITFTALLTACASNEKSVVKVEDLQTPVWHLMKIDNKSVEVPANKKTPSLSVDTRMTASGFSGCNDYLGEAVLDVDKHQFQIINMNSTQKLCLKNEIALESAIAETLYQPSHIDINQGKLILKGKKHTLLFEAKGNTNPTK